MNTRADFLIIRFMYWTLRLLCIVAYNSTKEAEENGRITQDTANKQNEVQQRASIFRTEIGEF